MLPAHKHNLDIRGHSHSIIDRGHNHPVVDKQHNHSIATGSGAPGSSFVAGTGSGSLNSQSSFTGINSTESAFTGIQVDSAYENITMATTGSGQPLSTLQPYACVHYIIKF
jgi:microcystin-dependent protein